MVEDTTLIDEEGTSHRRTIELNRTIVATNIAEVETAQIEALVSTPNEKTNQMIYHVMSSRPFSRILGAT